MHSFSINSPQLLQNNKLLILAPANAATEMFFFAVAAFGESRTLCASSVPLCHSNPADTD